MTQADYDRLDARIRALFLIQAQSFSLTVSKAVGAGNEKPVMEQYHDMAVRYAQLWPERLREDGIEAIHEFFALLDVRPGPAES